MIFNVFYTIMDKKDIGYRLKSFIKAQGLTQSVIAMQMGKTQSEISEMISGRRRFEPLATYLCDKYGASMDYFIKGEENKLSDIIANNNISENGLSHDDKVRLLDKLEILYERHQVILKTISDATKESGDILKEIAAINKLLIVGTQI